MSVIGQHMINIRTSTVHSPNSYPLKSIHTAIVALCCSVCQTIVMSWSIYLKQLSRDSVMQCMNYETCMVTWGGAYIPNTVILFHNCKLVSVYICTVHNIIGHVLYIHAHK